MRKMIIDRVDTERLIVERVNKPHGKFPVFQLYTQLFCGYTESKCQMTLAEQSALSLGCMQFRSVMRPCADHS